MATKPQRKLVFLDRAQAAAARRAVDAESKSRLFSVLDGLATQNNFKFHAVEFDDLPFVQQEEVGCTALSAHVVTGKATETSGRHHRLTRGNSGPQAMRGAAIAVGVHGANLVNSIFQPSLTVLVELMPYGFEHDMYVEAGRAGIKYYTHQMSTGEEFSGRSSYPTVTDCINHNHDCKVSVKGAGVTASDRVDAVV